MSHTTHRARHQRGQFQHFGELEATLVELSSALGVYAAGDDVESVLAALHVRLTALEGSVATSAAFTADAVIKAVQSASFTADAITLVTASASATADAIVQATVSASFTADAWVETEATSSFTLDAVVEAEQTATFSADAVILATISPSATADAVVEAEQTASFTADAEIVTATTFNFTAASIIKRTMPTAVVLSDDFSPDVTDSWGSPDIGLPYTYTSGEETFDKVSGEGQMYDNVTTHRVTANDLVGGAQDKVVSFKFDPEHPASVNNFLYIYFRGAANYLRYRVAAGVGTDAIELFTNSTSRGSHDIGSKLTSGYVEVRIEAIGTSYKAKVWQGGSEPDWQIEFDGGTAEPGYVRFHHDGDPWFGTNGQPWTFLFDDLVITAYGQGVMSADAIVQSTISGSFTADAAVSATQAASFSVDAVIEGAGEVTSTLGEMTLGDGTLGG